MADATMMPSTAFTKKADTLIGRLQGLVTNWRKAQAAEKTAMYLALETTTHEVMSEMSQQEPEMGKRRKWLLKPDYFAYFKEKGVASSNNAQYPFNAPFKLVIYPHIDWKADSTDPDKVQEKKNASDDVSMWSQVAAFSVMRDKKISDLIAEYGSPRKAANEFRVKDEDERQRENEAAERAAKEKLDAAAKERREKKEQAEKERKENDERTKESRRNEAEARRETARVEAARKESLKAAQVAETAAKKAAAARAKAEREEKEAEERLKKLEDDRKEQERLQKEAEQRANLVRKQNEEAEKRLKDQADQTKKLEASAKDKPMAKSLKLSSAKDRTEALGDLSEAWLRVKKNNGDWIITYVAPADQSNVTHIDENKRPPSTAKAKKVAA